MDNHIGTTPPPHFMQQALKNRSFCVGLILTVIITTMAVLSFVWTPYDVVELNIGNKLKFPNRENWFGTDHFGRDVFSMIMVGAKNSIAVSIVAVSIGMGIGVPLGMMGASSQSWISNVIMRSNDFIFAFPSLLLAILFTAIFGASAINAMIAIGIFNIPVFARLAYGGALTLWQREFILSAQTSGKNKTRITFEHIMPNLLNILIVQGTIQFSLGILIEASLSYLGLGTQPPQPSWGKMLSEAQTMMAFAPHLAIIPGVAIIVTVLGLNLLGDGLRDIFDPKLRQKR